MTPETSQHLLDRDVVVLQQVRSIMRDDFDIYGIDGDIIGRIVTNGSKLSRFVRGSRELDVVDINGAPIMKITDPANLGRDTYEVLRPDTGEKMAVITKRITLLKKKLGIEIAGLPPVEFHGNALGYDAELRSGDQVLATIKRQWSGMSDMLMGKQTYVVSFAPGVPRDAHASILGSAIAADLIRTKEAKYSN